MAITKTTVNINAILADDSAAASAVLTFTLSRPGREESAIMPDPVEVTLDSSGDGSVALWANETDDTYSYYTVVASFYRDSPYTSDLLRTETLGRIYVPSSGPVEVGDLLAEYTSSLNEDWGSVAASATLSSDYGSI